MSNRNPIISVIMPAYNHEKYVGEAIESVLNQSFEDFEFIIINDGSTDGTDRVIRIYNDPRIRYYTQENMDAYNALNRGLSLAKGRYISIINSDDVYHKERLSFLYNTIKSFNYKFIITDINPIDDHSNLLLDKDHWFHIYFERLKAIYNKTGSLETTLLSGNISVSTSNFFFKRDLVSDIGYFRPYRYAHDYDYVLRVLQKFKDQFIFYPDKKYLFYRIHQANTIKESHDKVFKETLSVLIDYVVNKITNQDDQKFINNALELIGETYIFELGKLGKEWNREVKNITDTVSWKVTKPLRILGALLGWNSKR